MHCAGGRKAGSHPCWRPGSLAVLPAGPIPMMPGWHPGPSASILLPNLHARGMQGAVLAQHPTLSISQAGTTLVLAILLVHCPWALPLYGPLPSSPHVRDWLCSPHLWTHMGSSTSPPGSPKTYIHTLTSLPQPNPSHLPGCRGIPSSPKVAGSLYIPLPEPAEG